MLHGNIKGYTQTTKLILSRSLHKNMSKCKSTKLPTFKQESPKPSSNHYLTLHRIKQITGWLPKWLPGQKRVFVCQLMENCSREQLELLATSLEPILHLDFSTSLGPHLQALHLDRAATFHVQRTLIQNVLNPLRSLHSWACLESLPLTSSDGNGLTIQKSPPSRPKIPQEVILPSLPLTHPRHKTSRSIEDIVSLRKQQFGSIPDFISTANLLRNVRHKELLRSPSKSRRRTKSLEAVSSDVFRQAESFKTQLIGISKWMDGWGSSQRAYLLLEVVKMCDKDLLGYFVQCLHQRLHETMEINSFSDGILLRIFSYLTPLSLCRAAQTCKRWNRLSCQGSLWRAHCHALSSREGLGDLSKAVEMAFGHPLQEDKKVDWKKTYRDLCSVLTHLKDMLLKTTKKTKRQVASRSSKTKNADYSLKQMLQILRGSSKGSSRPPTTRDLLRSAHESPACTRRRQRTERHEAHLEYEKLEEERLHSVKYNHRKPRDRSTPQLRQEESLSQEDGDWRSYAVPLVEVAVDTRPYLLAIPHPEGIECLVLSGALNSHLKPGKVQTIPKVLRLPRFLSTVHCLQCDQKKMMAGTANREILVRDIRTGRPVSTLTGHKGSVQCLQYDAYKIVSGSWDTTCIVWDAVHFEPLRELHGHTDCVSCLQFNQDYLVTGSHDKSLRVWSTSTWSCVTVIGDAHSGPVLCVQFNQWVIASGAADKTVRLWSPTTHHLLHTLSHTAPVSSLHLSNVLLITASLSGDILLWNVTSGTLLLEMSKAGEASMMSLSLASHRLYGAGSDGVLYEWDICSGNCVRKLIGHSSGLTCVWAGNDKIVTASEDNTVCVWYTKTAVAKELTDKGINADSFFTELPIRVITEQPDTEN